MNYFTAQMLSRLALLEYKMAALEAIIQAVPPIENKPNEPAPEPQAISAETEPKAAKTKKDYEIKEKVVTVQTMIPTKNIAP